MRKSIFIVIMILLSGRAMSQENMITVSGGYASANIEDTSTKGTGYRINGLYEFSPLGGKFAHGVSFGYIHLSSCDTYATNTINSFPLYYAPKVMFGSEKAKFFIKGAIGVQFAGLKRDALVSIDDSDFGFYGGAGTGGMLFLKQNIFLTAEYEIAWASNNWYRDGWISTFSAGIGFKF